MTRNELKIKSKNLFILIDTLITYLKQRGVEFNDQGFPIFNEGDFLGELPESIIPYSHRHDTKSKAHTVVSFYEPDKLLYGRLTFEKLKKVSEELKEYKGFVGYDLSIFKDFLYPFQKFYVMANLVLTKFLVVEGNKFYPNLRADESGGDLYFKLFANAPIVCCGTLGCSKFKEQRKTNKEQIDKYCETHPKQLLIQYGGELSKKQNSIHFKPYGRKKVKLHG